MCIAAIIEGNDEFFDDGDAEAGEFGDDAQAEAAE
jgi:hypothetical protein